MIGSERVGVDVEIVIICIIDDKGVGQALKKQGVNVDEVRDCIKRFYERLH